MSLLPGGGIPKRALPRLGPGSHLDARGGAAARVPAPGLLQEGGQLAKIPGPLGSAVESL